MKHKRVKRKMTNKQAMITIISVLCAAALLVVLLVVIGPVLGGNDADPHAGHDHSSDTDLGDGHYEGDGHDHSGTGSTADSDAKVKYQLYTNADKTSRLVFRDDAGQTIAEFDNLQIAEGRQPSAEVVEANEDIYELGWATGDGANDFECIYYNVKTGQVSDKFTAPRGTDGVRVAYGSADQTKVVVQDLFDKDAYSKEYALEEPYAGEGDVIMGGRLQDDKKTVVISYKDKEGAGRHAVINLYE